MLKEREAVIRRVLILLDGCVVVVSFFIAFVLRRHFHIFYRWDLIPSSQIIRDFSVSLNVYFLFLYLAVPLWCVLLYINGMYESLRTRNFWEILWIIVKSSFLGILIFGTIIFIFELRFVSRTFFILFFAVSTVGIFLEKAAIYSVMHSVRRRGYNYRSLLIVGTGPRAARFIRRIKQHPEWGLRILGAVDDEPGRGISSVDGTRVIGTLDDLPDLLHKNPVDEVIFVVPRSRLNYMEEAIYACEIEGIRATIAVDLFDLKLARARLTEIEGIPLLRFQTTVAREGHLFVKRAIDIIVSGASIILLSPFFFITAVLIKLTSSGPVLFRQERLGLNGRRFTLYKFRTMYEGAQKKLTRVNVFKDMDNPSFKKKKMQYMTPVGKLLRKLSIDELPQLFNVFVGHMSLVGPRPSVPEEVKQYRPWQRRRLSMRPGITCLWQMSGRNKLGFEEWVKLDLEYLDNWSLWLDLKILAKTIPVVLLGIGAY